MKFDKSFKKSAKPCYTQKNRNKHILMIYFNIPIILISTFLPISKIHLKKKFEKI